MSNARNAGAREVLPVVIETAADDQTRVAAQFVPSPAMPSEQVGGRRPICPRDACVTVSCRLIQRLEPAEMVVTAGVLFLQLPSESAISDVH